MAGEAFRRKALVYPDVPAQYRDESYLLLAITFLLFSVVGAPIVSRRPRNRVGWILCTVGLAYAIQHAADGYSALGFFGSPGSLPLAMLALWIGQWAGIPTIWLATTLLPLLFPDGRLPSPRWRLFLQVSVAVGVFFCLDWAFARGPLQRAALDNPLGAPSPLGDVLAALRPAGWYAIILSATVATASLVARYRRGDHVERAQIRWVAYAAVLMAVAIVTSAALFPFITGRTDDAARFLQVGSIILTVVGLAALPVAAGAAVMRYHLYGIDTLISRTFVYGSLTAILAGLYAASIKLFQSLFVAATGDESDAAVVITTLVLASSFTPIKRRLEAFVERRFEAVPARDASGVGATPASLPAVGRLTAELRDHAERLARLERELAPSTSGGRVEAPADSSGPAVSNR